LALLLAYGSWSFLEAYPFADSNHLLWAIQPAFIGLAYLGYRFWQALRARLTRPSRWPAALVIAPCLLIVAAQLGAIVGHFYLVEQGFRPAAFELLEPPRADVYVNVETAATLRAVAAEIRQRTGEHDRLFDTNGAFLYFLSARDNATPCDFLWPGFLGKYELERLIADLDQRRPALIVRNLKDEQQRRLGYGSLRDNYPSLFEYIERNYRREVEIGAYSLWSLK
jgi:hypothetical protein